MTPDVLVPTTHTLTAIRRETHDTLTHELAGDAPGIGPIEPGQFVMVSVPGVGEAPISVATIDPDRFALTFRVVGSVTTALASLGVGDTVGIRGPYGIPWPIDEARGGDILVVAGGIGLAPLRAAIEEAIEERDAFGAVAVVYGARTPDDIVFAEELTAWRARFDLDVEVTVDRAPARWHGSVGLVTRLLDRVGIEPAATTAMICGPEIMMRATGDALVASGVPAGRVHVTLERRMWCAVGGCGHCQLGPAFVCRDGPVFAWPDAIPLMSVPEL